MDSSLSLFSFNPPPNYTVEDFSLNNKKNEKSLPPEPQIGNVEYKLKIINPSREKFEHLVTQLKWRLQEGDGDALYAIGVENCGFFAGLTPREMKASLRTLRRMALVLGASVEVLRTRILDNGLNIAEVLVRKSTDV